LTNNKTGLLNPCVPDSNANTAQQTVVKQTFHTSCHIIYHVTTRWKRQLFLGR